GLQFQRFELGLSFPVRSKFQCAKFYLTKKISADVLTIAYLLNHNSKAKHQEQTLSFLWYRCNLRHRLRTLDKISEYSYIWLLHSLAGSSVFSTPEQAS